MVLRLLKIAAVRVARRPRVLLNVVGMVIGAAGVLSLLTVEDGIAQAARQQMASLAPDLVVVSPTTASRPGVGAVASSLTQQDAVALGDPAFVPHEAEAVPTAGVHTDVNALDRTWRTDVIGSGDGFATVRGYQIQQGRFFSAGDVNAGTSVAVVGQTVAVRLFAGDDPVGRIVRIGAHPYRVVGVFKAKGLAGSSYDQDDVVAVPITTVWAYLLPPSTPRVEQVLVRASSPQQTPAVEREVTQVLMRRHGITNPSQFDFQVRSQRELLSSFNRTGNLLGWMLAAITAVSLLMGAIGVTTVTLATVSERAREIGIRRSVGATHLHIFVQFLFEALVMSIAGGLLGVVVGAEAVLWANRLLPELPQAALSWHFALIAFVSVLLVGLTAGTYPALRAARLQPAVGLRQF